jgi:hypothetical protein
MSHGSLGLKPGGKSADPFYHSERSEESLFLFLGLHRGEFPRFALHDNKNYFFRKLNRLCQSRSTINFAVARNRIPLQETNLDLAHAPFRRDGYS